MTEKNANESEKSLSDDSTPTEKPRDSSLMTLGDVSKPLSTRSIISRIRHPTSAFLLLISILCLVASIILVVVNQVGQGSDIATTKVLIEKAFEDQCGIYDILRQVPPIGTVSKKLHTEGVILYKKHNCALVLKEVKK